MIKDIMKIAGFLDKTGRTKDSNFIDYIAEKYAGGDLSEFFHNKMQKDFMASEYGTRPHKRRIEPSREEGDTAELLRGLSVALKD